MTYTKSSNACVKADIKYDEAYIGQKPASILQEVDL